MACVLENGAPLVKRTEAKIHYSSVCDSRRFGWLLFEGLAPFRLRQLGFYQSSGRMLLILTGGL